MEYIIPKTIRNWVQTETESGWQSGITTVKIDCLVFSFISALTETRCVSSVRFMRKEPAVIVGKSKLPIGLLFC